MADAADGDVRHPSQSQGDKCASVDKDDVHVHVHVLDEMCGFCYATAKASRTADMVYPRASRPYSPCALTVLYCACVCVRVCARARVCVVWSLSSYRTQRHVPPHVVVTLHSVRSIHADCFVIALTGRLHSEPVWTVQEARLLLESVPGA